MKTQVLSILELHALIPETATLNERKFENLQDILTNVVQYIEQSGKWEFVQYIKDNPSLFIIREIKSSSEISISLTDVEKKIQDALHKLQPVQNKSVRHTITKQENTLPSADANKISETVEKEPKKRFEPVILPNQDYNIFKDKSIKW